MNKHRHTYRLIFLMLCLMNMGKTAAQSFTGAEQQSISIETPGLFERSDAFRIDFRYLKNDEYSFPLPVGKSGIITNGNLEINTTKGDAVKAMFDGTVRLSYKHSIFGNIIVIRHNNGLETVYGDNAENRVKVGDKVKAGQTIAIVGGKEDRIFCTFAIMINGRRINPETIIDVKSHRLKRQVLLCKKENERINISVEREERKRSTFSPDIDPFEKSNTVEWNLSEMEGDEWCYPLPDAKVISPYGNNRGSHIHSGVDLKTKPNDNVRAAFDGEVILSGPNSGYGNCIKIKHGNGLVTLYGHQSKNLVKAGDRVKAGQIIGLAGRTGHATTEHVHFEVFFCGRRYNPNIIFDHTTRGLRLVTLVINKNGSVTTKKR
ncbi:MAG: M23 family metallopeptidase [Prevotella sp.]|nr:M23 family metallopeptidase [Prevotella sp.]